jgi:hypothetical protein
LLPPYARAHPRANARHHPQAGGARAGRGWGAGRASAAGEASAETQPPGAAAVRPRRRAVMRARQPGLRAARMTGVATPPSGGGGLGVGDAVARAVGAYGLASVLPPAAGESWHTCGVAAGEDAGGVGGVSERFKCARAPDGRIGGALCSEAAYARQ